MKAIVIGELLWDVFPDGERLGGAPFNFAAHLRRLGHDVIFISAVGQDRRGEQALAEMARLDLRPEFVTIDNVYETGRVTVTLDSRGEPDYTIHRPAAYDFAEVGGRQWPALSKWQPEWIYFGTLHHMSPQARALLGEVLVRLPGAQRFYDVNLRKDSFTPELVRELLEAASVVKLNEHELGELGVALGVHGSSLSDVVHRWVQTFDLAGICVTRGAEGCAGLLREEFFDERGVVVEVADAVGAGDAFAAGFLHGVGGGWPVGRTARFANALGGLVASRSGAIPDWSPKELGL